jgi:4-diphosphocytidyl-2-C-methyl-D-erythritol kinase
VITFPNCKINLGLRVLSKRTDGYHNLETVFVPVPFEDCLEIERAQGESSLAVSGLIVDGPTENNLCWKAYQLMKNEFRLPAIDIHLHKQIPSGAGLGGGSSDAAFTLKLLNEKFRLQLSQDDLLKLAAKLGSDCPFFIINTPCIGRGRGEQLEPLQLPQLEGLFGIIVLPPIHISSAWAFQQLTPKEPAIPLVQLLQRPIQDWREELINDFENPVFNFHPKLREIKDQLYDAGATYASMSGSGAAIYGVFKKMPEITFDSSFAVKSFAFKKGDN